MEERILIINSDGLLSALPTPDEYNAGVFSTKNMVVGRVRVDSELSQRIHLVKGSIKVLSPELPQPQRGEGLLYLAIVDGLLVAV